MHSEFRRFHRATSSDANHWKTLAKHLPMKLKVNNVPHYIEFFNISGFSAYFSSSTPSVVCRLPLSNTLRCSVLDSLSMSLLLLFVCFFQQENEARKEYLVLGTKRVYERGCMMTRTTFIYFCRNKAHHHGKDTILSRS